MGFNLFGKSSSHLAVDIGSQYTKFVSVARGKNRKYQIQEFLIKPTPENSFESGKISNLKKLSDFLVEVFSEAFERENKIVGGVSGKGMIIKKIDIPKMDENLIPEHLSFEAEQYIPYDISEMDLDYEILDSSSKDSISVLFAAVLKKTVAEYLNLFSESQLNCEILDGNMFALANIFEHNYGIYPDKNLMLCDIRAGCSTLVGVCGGKTVFARSIPVGGDYYTKEIQKNFKVSPQEAEDLKKSALSGEEDGSREVFDFIQKVHSDFCDELKSSYEFYVNFFPENKISEMFVTGGGSQTKGLLKALEESFSLPFTLLDPFQKMDLAPHLKDQEEYLRIYSPVGLGLSLRGLN